MGLNVVCIQFNFNRLNTNLSIKVLKRKKRECYLALPSIGINMHPQNRDIAPILGSMFEPQLINSPVKLPNIRVANRYNSIDFIVINFNDSIKLFVEHKIFFL